MIFAALSGITINPTIRSAKAKLRINKLETVLNRFSVLKACRTSKLPKIVNMARLKRSEPRRIFRNNISEDIVEDNVVLFIVILNESFIVIQ